MSEGKEPSLLEKVEQSAASLVKYGKIYNEEEKARMLAMLPYVEEEAANKAVILSYDYEMAKLKQKRLKNKLMVDAAELKESLGLTNSKLQEAWAESNEEYQSLEEEILRLKKEQGLQSNQAERFSKQYAAISKLITKDINSDFLINSSQRRIG